MRRKIGPYSLVRRLGAGGMGIVYLARDDAGQSVAVKVMRPELASQEEFRRRFGKEAEAARRVARFCTAAVLDVGIDGDQAYLVTEYVDGPDLTAVIEAQGPMTVSNLEALAVSVATALTVIHRAGVVHRDLKPANILLAPVGPRVIDFGIAQLADTLATQSEDVLGTPAYMSPEHGRGGPVTAASDVFAWAGVVTYAATGQPPFGNGRPTEVLYRIVNHVPRLDGLDERLRPLVERALDKHPGRRPTSQQLLDRLLGKEDVPVETATQVVNKVWTSPLTRIVTEIEDQEAGHAKNEERTETPEGAERSEGAGHSEGTRRWGGAGGSAGTGRPAFRRWLPVVLAVACVAIAAAVLYIVLPQWTSSTGEEVARKKDVQIGGVKIHVEITQLARQEKVVTLQWTVKNLEPAGGGSWRVWNEMGSAADDYTVSRVALIAPSTGGSYLPASRNGVCLCSATNGVDIKPGDVRPFQATYTDVPQGIEVVNVDIKGMAVFTGVPITQ